MATARSAAATVSVVVPAYNGRAHIARALRSVFWQTRPPKEIIVVDDASSDGTPEIVARLARQSPVPLHLICLPRNSGGPAHPQNVGITVASGDVIAVLDQDDTFYPTKLQDQVGALDDDPEAALAFSTGASAPGPACGALHRDILEHAEPRDQHIRLTGERFLFLLLKHGTFVVGYPAFVFRRRDWCDKGGLDESLRIASDYELLCWLAGRGPVAFVPKPVFVKHRHGENLSDTSPIAAVEVAKVLTQYLSSAPLPLQGNARELREALLHSGYWLRHAGDHRASWQAYQLAARCAGLNWCTTRDTLKLIAHWGWSRTVVLHKASREFNRGVDTRPPKTSRH